MLGAVYVVQSSFQKLSEPFIQYITSPTFWKYILLSLAMFASVRILVVTPAAVIVYNLCVESVLCLTTSLSLLATVLR